MGMSKIPRELEAQMTPAVKAAFLELLAWIDGLTAKLSKLTPQNSSLPPSSVHPHAKPKPKPKPGNKRKQRGQKGYKRHQVWELPKIQPLVYEYQLFRGYGSC